MYKYLNLTLATIIALFSGIILILHTDIVQANTTGICPYTTIPPCPTVSGFIEADCKDLGQLSPPEYACATSLTSTGEKCCQYEVHSYQCSYFYNSWIAPGGPVDLNGPYNGLQLVASIPNEVCQDTANGPGVCVPPY